MTTAMPAMIWEPIENYPEIEPGQKGPTVLMCQEDTATWGVGYAVWYQSRSAPVFYVNGVRCDRPTHFVDVRDYLEYQLPEAFGRPVREAV